MKQTQTSYKARLTALINLLREQPTFARKTTLRNQFKIGTATLKALEELGYISYDFTAKVFRFNVQNKSNYEIIKSVRSWCRNYQMNELWKGNKRGRKAAPKQLDIPQVRRPRKKVSVWRKLINKIKSIF